MSPRPADVPAAPIIPASKWGRPYRSGTPPLLTHLTRLLSLSTSSSPSQPLTPESDAHLPDVDLLDTITASSGHSEVYDAPLIEDGAELGEPALVVSVEADAIDFGWDNWVSLHRSLVNEVHELKAFSCREN